MGNMYPTVKLPPPTLRLQATQLGLGVMGLSFPLATKPTLIQEDLHLCQAHLSRVLKLI